jgi:hypothetical protein
MTSNFFLNHAKKITVVVLNQVEMKKITQMCHDEPGAK